MPTNCRKIDKVVKIQTWHMDRFAAFLKKMAETNDGDGSLLDHSIFMYGSNMGNSDKHSNWPIPTVIVGGGNGKMKLGGQHVALEQRTPLANVHLTLLDKFGIEQTRFADSTGVISELVKSKSEGQVGHGSQARTQRRNGGGAHTVGVAAASLPASKRATMAAFAN